MTINETIQALKNNPLPRHTIAPEVYQVLVERQLIVTFRSGHTTMVRYRARVIRNKQQHQRVSALLAYVPEPPPTLPLKPLKLKTHDDILDALADGPLPITMLHIGILRPLVEKLKYVAIENGEARLTEKGRACCWKG